ncbi:MAG: fasciclin domain-containing protein [Myxococcales bacterium]|nr:fasciclin domain-containing protein [Myxococcales bacterium]
MLRRVLAGQGGSARQGRANARCPARTAWCSGLVLLAGLAIPCAAQAADPFPPSEASEHFDAQARVGKKDILATLQADSRFQTAMRALDAAGLLPLLRMRGPLTLFIPTNAAFDKLAAGQFESWLKQPKVLKAILRYHMLKAYVPSKQLSRLRNALTAAYALVTIDGSSGIKVNGASVISTDLYASNGVIHVIDTVLIPPEAKPSGKKKRGDKGKPQTPSETASPDDSESKL